MEIREVHDPNDGRDPFPVLIRRQKMAKDRDNLKSKHCICLSSYQIGWVKDGQNISQGVE